MAEITMETITEKALMVITVSGEVTGAELVDAIKRFYSAGAPKNALWDFSRADVLTVSSDSIQRFVDVASLYAKDRPGGRTALVQTSELGYGLSRMYELTAESADYPIALSIFRSRQEALDSFGPVE